MKNKFKLLVTFLVVLFVFGLNSISFSQPPPPPSIGHGSAGNVPAGGGGAPVGEGMFLLIGLAGLYGGYKIYTFKKSLKNTEA